MIAGERALAKHTVSVRHLRDGGQHIVAIADLSRHIAGARHD